LRAVIGWRWPETEEYIYKHPKMATLYASQVIRGRWPEAEPYIMNSRWEDWYIEFVLKQSNEADMMKHLMISK